MVAASMECMSSGSPPASDRRSSKRAGVTAEFPIGGTGRRTSSRLQNLREKRGRDICYNDDAVRKAEASRPRKKAKVSHKRKKSGSADVGGDKEPMENIEGSELMNLGLHVEFVNELQNGIWVLIGLLLISVAVRISSKLKKEKKSKLKTEMLNEKRKKT